MEHWSDEFGVSIIHYSKTPFDPLFGFPKDDIRSALSNVTVFSYIGPVEDPISLQDVELDG